MTHSVVGSVQPTMRHQVAHCSAAVAALAVADVVVVVALTVPYPALSRRSTYFVVVVPAGTFFAVVVVAADAASAVVLTAAAIAIEALVLSFHSQWYHYWSVPLAQH